jgi:superfamily II DNA helicase RecQ
MKIRESNGTYKVTITSLAGQEVTVYRERSGGLTFEVREVAEEAEEAEELEFERVPLFREEERETFATQEEDVKEEDVQDVQEEAIQTEVTKEEAMQKEAAEIAYIQEYYRNNTLFHKLSDLRRQLATEEEVPPFMIFHDKTLWGMVEKMPVNLSALANIKGVGKAKLEKYGVKFLSALLEGVA